MKILKVANEEASKGIISSYHTELTMLKICRKFCLKIVLKIVFF